MPTQKYPGKLADGDWRRDRARKGAQARTTLDYHLQKVIDQAPTLTADQIERLRGLLPPARGGVDATAA